MNTVTVKEVKKGRKLFVSVLVNDAEIMSPQDSLNAHRGINVDQIARAIASDAFAKIESPAKFQEISSMINSRGLVYENTTTIRAK